MMTAFICVLGGFCFIMCGMYLVKDREKADEYTLRTCEDENSLLGSVASERYTPLPVEEDDKDTVEVPVDVHGTLPVQDPNNHLI